MSNIDWDLASKVMVMAIVISVILLLFGIGALIFIHVCIVARTFRRGFGNDGSTAERGSNGSTSLSRDDVQKLPCYDYISKSKGSSSVECAVCLDNFKKGDKCRLLPLCNHSFHAHCVDTWLLKNPNCPICRTTADSRRFGEESSRFSDIYTDLRDENRETENRQLNDVRIDLRESQTMQSIHVSDVGTESRQNQITSPVGTQLGSVMSPLPDSRLENV